MLRRLSACLVALPACLAVAESCLAHGFGQRYDLPIPLAHYLWGAGATVAFSFVIFAVFLKANVRPPPVRRMKLHGIWRTSACAGAVLVRVFGLVAFLIIVVAGTFGEQNPIRNIAPAFVWIIGWVGLAFLSPLFGNVWRLINPWDTLFRAGQWMSCRWRDDRGQSSISQASRRRYPEWLGVWPAFVLFIVFAWMELVWSGRSVPADLAAALMLYSVVTLTGMAIFGRARWLERGEVFTLVFGIFARFAPLACRREELTIRMPASGLIDDRPLHPSMVALVIAVLATVTFDGFLETPVWARLDATVLNAPYDSILWTLLREDQALRLTRSIALPAAILIFVAGYLAVCRCMSALSPDARMTTGMLARRFVFTLVPIALAYHVAHYVSYLFVGGQYAIPLLSDPFGWGWNLFGTASYQIDIGVIGPRLQWYVAVVSVVLGHIIAVCLSHIVALRIYPQGRAALVTQIPMLVLMVGYTMCSLWILSQPIVETGPR